MEDKKIMKLMRMMVVGIVLLAIFAIGSVSAVDVDDTPIVGDDTGQMKLSADNLKNNEDNNILTQTDNDESASTQSNSEILGDDIGNYSGLSNEIKSGKNVELKHKYYKYDSGSTIVITGDNMVIDGKGAVIDMAGSKDMGVFKVKSSGVTIKNLSIKNANYTGNGGAIYFDESGIVTDCNFINNAVYNDGGAIYFYDSGTVTGCNFINNSAVGYAGAVSMTSGSVTNCNFINGTSLSGSAVFIWGDGNVMNCNFTNNSVVFYGGAIYCRWGSVANCNFINNAASYDGGAVYIERDVGMINCNFINNAASDNGGAVCLGWDSTGTVTNCNFTNSSAELGKAIYTYGDSAISRCNFETQGCESLSELVMGGIISNCTVNGNKAKTTVTININGTTYGETLKVIVIVENHATGKIILTIKNAQSYDANIENGQATFNISGLNPGNYKATVNYSGDSNYMAFENITQISVSKVHTVISSSPVATVYNGNKNLLITLRDAKGNPLSGVKITVNLNGVKTYPTNKNGQAKVSTNGLAPKAYTAKITFNGNTIYDKSTKSVKVTVKKAAVILTAKAKSFKKSSKSKKYVVVLKTNQNKVMKNTKLTLKVNGKTYSATTNAKGKATFKITKLTKKGGFTATIKYAGSKYYNAKTVKAKIVVK